MIFIKELIKKFLSLTIYLYLLFVRKRKFVPEEVKSILFVCVKPTGIGDMLMNTPSYKSVRKKFPKAKITLLTDKDVLRGNESFDEIVLVSSFWECFLQDKYDLVLLTNKNLLQSIPSLLLFKKYILGYIHSWRVTSNFNEKTEGEFLVDRTHLYDMGFEVVKNLGIKDFEGRIDSLQFTNGELLRVKKLISYEETDKVVVVNPPSLWVSRAWPKSHYYELVKKLVVDGFKVVINGGPMDKEYNYDFNMRGVFNLTGEIDLYELSALCSLAGLFVTNDCGPMHVSIAQKTPTLSLWGPTNPRRRIPRKYVEISLGCYLLEDDENFPFICPNGVCEDAYFFEHPPKGYDKMKFISVDEVYDKVISMLKPKVI